MWTGGTAPQGVLDNAGFPSRVTAHFVAVDGQSRPRTTILIKFAEEVREAVRCGLDQACKHAGLIMLGVFALKLLV